MEYNMQYNMEENTIWRTESVDRSIGLFIREVFEVLGKKASGTNLITE
jgi:hypothetical protein